MSVEGEPARDLGIALDDGRSAAGGPPISAVAGRARARVIRKDEESMIAREVIRLGVARP